MAIALQPTGGIYRPPLSPNNQHRLAIRPQERDEAVRERLLRRLNRARVWAIECPGKAQGESLAIVIHTSDGDDFSLFRVIGIYYGGAIQQRIGGVISGDRIYFDPQSNMAFRNRNHARELELAADLRKLGRYAEARAALVRALSERAGECVL